jgi:hypothetical protein
MIVKPNVTRDERNPPNEGRRQSQGSIALEYLCFIVCLCRPNQGIAGLFNYVTCKQCRRTRTWKGATLVLAVPHKSGALSIGGGDSDDGLSSA